MNNIYISKKFNPVKMVSWEELKARVRDFFHYRRSEVIGLVAAVLVTAFVFGFRDWGGEEFNVLIGSKNLLTILIIVGISLLFRTACQKIYALSEGYQAEFKVWWAGLAIAFVIAFITLGKVPLVLVGTMSAAFMVKQRLGEFRYGFSHWNNAMIGYWGMLGSLIMALLFALGWYFSPQSFFFSKGLLFNIIAAFCALIPIPQLDGLSIFYGSRKLYFSGILLALLAAVLLLLTRTAGGLIAAYVIGIGYAIIYIMISSEK